MTTLKGQAAQDAVLGGAIVKMIHPGLYLVDVARTYRLGDWYGVDLDVEVPEQLVYADLG